MLLIYFIGVALFIVLDQITKLWADKVLKFSDSIVLIKDIFQLTYVENRGAAFGVLQNQRVFFVIITVLVIGAIMFFILKYKPQNKLLFTSLMMITGGALGNFIDRFFRGYVIDFLDFCLINFPVFNIADCFVVVGAILLSIYVLFFSPDFPEDKEKLSAKRKADENEN